MARRHKTDQVCLTQLVYDILLCQCPERTESCGHWCEYRRSYPRYQLCSHQKYSRILERTTCPWGYHSSIWAVSWQNQFRLLKVSSRSKEKKNQYIQDANGASYKWNQWNPVTRAAQEEGPNKCQNDSEHLGKTGAGHGFQSSRKCWDKSVWGSALGV